MTPPVDAARATVTSTAPRFAERERARRRRTWRRLLVGLLVLGLVAGGVYAAGWTDLLAVHRIEVTGVEGDEATAVAALVGVKNGTPLVRVDTGAVEQRVRERRTVAEASVRRSWPNTLTVAVVPRVAVLVVVVPGGRLEKVDATGTSFGTVPKAPAGIPVVTASGSDGMTPQALTTVLAVLHALPRTIGDKVRTVTVSSADLVTFVVDGKTVVWGGAEDSVRKVEIVEALLRKSPKVIDVSAPDTPVTR